jgi:hypothetical protein
MLRSRQFLTNGMALYARFLQRANYFRADWRFGGRIPS